MLDTYRELIDLLAATPVKLQTAAAQAGAPPAGEWDAAQVLGHLAAVEQLWLDRLNVMLRERNALVGGMTPKATEVAEKLAGQDVAACLAEFNRLRGETISTMMGLSLTDWEKTAIHKTSGEISIEDLVETMVDHDSEHLAQLEALGGA